MPYLSMDLRKKLIFQLSSQFDKQNDIYQLLVSLRMCGKDADLLVEAIRQIAKIVGEDIKTLGIVIKFIEIAK